ncbi:Protein phosphatase Slingshot 2 [Saguinus oedipus]|uniref:Protein phosphatase Slingshot 2 n=1 Tax=Saguinus oedipus TaxID=9490 RepID=A0ABQ9VRD5_SAGOE|nr:Protein phosphatase Slingshot 2 [Saguinus oedipus]
MGVSRSASTVIAYAMKEYGWNLDRAYDYVKERRTVTKPNPSFMRQLEEYQGILLARKRYLSVQQEINIYSQTHMTDVGQCPHVTH